MHGDPAFPTDTREAKDAADSADSRTAPLPTAHADRAKCAGLGGSAARTARSARIARFARLGAVLLGAGLVLASCERTPTKAEYVDDRVAAECAGQTGDAFTLCRLDVIKKYMAVPLEEMQKQFPAPVRKDRLGCG